RGTGTKFKNNNPAINIGMTILIKSGTTNIPYMIKSVNSDTELVLAQPALATATNTAFSIHITEPDNNSDAARTMVAINAYTQYFLDAMNTWMTQTGQTKIEMPNGEIVTLDSIKKMQGDISKKADLTKQSIQTFNGIIEAIPSIWAKKTQNNWVGLVADEGRRYIASKGEGDPYHFKIFIPEKKEGTLMLAGDYGFGLVNNYINNKYLEDLSSPSCLFAMGAAVGSDYFSAYGAGINIRYDNNGAVRLFIYGSGNAATEYRSGAIIRRNMLWGALNTTTDPQGFIKKASPIININSDGTFTTNGESEGATVIRVDQGEYLIEGVLGFNADAGWGGVDGGIEIPLDVNKQPLIWVDSKVMEDGSILVKTYHRTHPNAPKFARNDIGSYNDGDPIDIPDGRFISVRVQMPEQSIYNVRMREMEEAQKAEEERRRKEEEIKEKYGLGENDILL
uniref:phage tail fiber protein n=1 Tax=Proteus penneri TaxID=102862 RepID=UPI00288B4295